MKRSNREREKVRGERRVWQTDGQKWTKEKGTNGLARHVRATVERRTEGRGAVVTGIERSFFGTSVTSAKAHHRRRDYCTVFLCFHVIPLHTDIVISRTVVSTQRNRV